MSRTEGRGTSLAPRVIFARTAIAASTALATSASSKSKNGARGMPRRKSGNGLFQRYGVVFLGVLRAGGIEFVVPGEYVQQQRCIFDRSDNRPTMIKREG